MEECKKVEEMNYFELLAWLGVGSSHPGGFPATKQTLETVHIKPGQTVLDAGCGSGLTACHLARTTGSRVTGIDINSEMIDKARERAEKESVSHLVDFQVADIYSLPFTANSFDWIFAESVTVFLDKGKAFGEFFRVLQPLGQVAELVLAALRGISLDLKSQFEDNFGQDTDPLSFFDWCDALAQAGFIHVAIRNPQPLQSHNQDFREITGDLLLFQDLEEKLKQPGLIPRLQKKRRRLPEEISQLFPIRLLYGQKPQFYRYLRAPK